MGDIPTDLPPSTAREIKVLVTGYGPFHHRFPVNVSWSIASSLPAFLPATAECPAIKIIVPPKPIDVAYHAVTEFADKWLTECDADIVVHIGLAAGRTFFALERQSFRDRYWEKKDVKGEVFSREETASLWPKDKFPAILKPTFDCEDVWTRWRQNVSEGLDVRNSDDPGNYLCGFIYYYSMAWFWGRDREERPVVFMHTPDLPTQERVMAGREAAIGLIRALVESREKTGVHDPLKDAANAIKPEIYQEIIEKEPLQAQNVAPAASGENDSDLAWSYKR